MPKLSETLSKGKRVNVRLTLEEVAFIEAALRDCADRLKNKRLKFDRESDRRALISDNETLAEQIWSRIKK